MLKYALLFSTVCLTLGSLPIHAAEACASPANLVQNCGFETGDFSGWSVSGDTANTGVDTFDAHTGTYGAYLAGFGSFNAGDTNFSLVEQTLVTKPGQDYTLIYYTAHATNADVTPDDVFAAGIDNQVIASSLQVNVANVPYLESPRLGFVATSSTTLLSFLAEDANFDFSLDDVSVVASPEPVDFGLMLAGVMVVLIVGKIKAGRFA